MGLAITSLAGITGAVILLGIWVSKKMLRDAETALGNRITRKTT